ncbi:GNAT family N-acetyltransferase [Tissierella sp. MSJ-40]|uniref:GNAT family N-acetyltransferase n=1 Tax=Tissierella simiarum TaxID=2841534 RepID=A0ABS6E3W1_9FIRM|nr:GNAT family N-acetyltransferase [Tissierella simiarum]MBU5437585.1 GNAT family N-acetyltransferase [Tissierella simiarum]
MLVLREINESEIYLITGLLKDENIVNNITNNDIIYVMYDNERIIGAAKATIVKDYGIFDYLLIIKDQRGSNLGDGLLRALLNKLNSIGIKQIFYSSENNYLLKKGFEYSIDSNLKLQIHIPTFLNRSCKSCGDLNDL